MINKKLIELRQEKDYTQLEMAEKLNMSKTGYAGWEQGRTEPNLTAIKKICLIFDISADELLEMDEYKKEK